MDINDKELFDSALTDETPEIAETTVEQPAADDGQPRDAQGRFATRQTEPEPQPEPVAPQAQQPAKEEAHVPSWRLREVREEADRRVADAEARWQRQFEMLQRQNQPKAEPTPVPDVFENPNAFLDHGVRQAVDPIKSEVQQTREFFSRMMAEQVHGADKVRAAYDWIKDGMTRGEPEAIAAYQRAMQTMHPFGELVTAHQQRAVYQQIGSDPNAWFEKELERRMGDQQFVGTLMQKAQQSVRQSTQAQQKIQLAPSLRNAPAAQASDDDHDGSDAALFRYAMR